VGALQRSPRHLLALSRPRGADRGTMSVVRQFPAISRRTYRVVKERPAGRTGEPCERERRALSVPWDACAGTGTAAPERAPAVVRIRPSQHATPRFFVQIGPSHGVRSDYRTRPPGRRAWVPSPTSRSSHAAWRIGPAEGWPGDGFAAAKCRSAQDLHRVGRPKSSQGHRTELGFTRSLFEQLWVPPR
jgi:hypothetical protein